MSDKIFKELARRAKVTHSEDDGFVVWSFDCQHIIGDFIIVKTGDYSESKAREILVEEIKAMME